MYTQISKCRILRNLVKTDLGSIGSQSEEEPEEDDIDLDKYLSNYDLFIWLHASHVLCLLGHIFENAMKK